MSMKNFQLRILEFRLFTFADFITERISIQLLCFLEW